MHIPLAPKAPSCRQNPFKNPHEICKKSPKVAFSRHVFRPREGGAVKKPPWRWRQGRWPKKSAPQTVPPPPQKILSTIAAGRKFRRKVRRRGRARSRRTAKIRGRQRSKERRRPAVWPLPDPRLSLRSEFIRRGTAGDSDRGRRAPFTIKERFGRPAAGWC